MSAPTVSARDIEGASVARPSRPRLLFLSQLLPFPPDGGAYIRTHHILRLLAQVYDVTALCFYRRRERPTPEHVQEAVRALSRWARVEAFEIPQEHSRGRFLTDNLLGVAFRRAFVLDMYRSAPYRRRVTELLREERYDIVHVDSMDMAAYLPLLDPERVVVVHHNVESQLLERRAVNERSRALATYSRFHAPLYRALEREWCPKVALNVLVSSEDARELRDRVGTARTVVVPNGIDTEGIDPMPGGARGIACVGGIISTANRDALYHLGENILPQLRRLVGDVPVTWVGRATDAQRREFADRFGIRLTGYVDDVAPHLADAACFVVPIRIGGGTRVKIVDAWARAKAVVSTSTGAEGLAIEEGRNILIRDDPGEFAAAVAQVLQDAPLRADLERHGRATAERVYSWGVVGQGLVAAYDRVIAAGR